MLRPTSSIIANIFLKNGVLLFIGSFLFVLTNAEAISIQKVEHFSE